MKEIEDITEAVQMLAEVYKELEISNADSKEYLENYIKTKGIDEGIESIKEFENAFVSMPDVFIARIYDLAIYNITGKLMSKINNKL